MALLYATQGLNNVRVDNQDQKVGVDIVRKALQVPARSIIDNSGLEGAVVIGKLLEEAKGDLSCTKGMNAANGQYVDMIKAGIIDPTKVVRTALTDASGVASLMTTTEAMIVDIPKEESPNMGGANPAAGMGGGMF
jgi:chaperonin GroEL